MWHDCGPWDNTSQCCTANVNRHMNRAFTVLRVTWKLCISVEYTVTPCLSLTRSVCFYSSVFLPNYPYCPCFSEPNTGHPNIPTSPVHFLTLRSFQSGNWRSDSLTAIKQHTQVVLPQECHYYSQHSFVDKQWTKTPAFTLDSVWEVLFRNQMHFSFTA